MHRNHRRLFVGASLLVLTLCAITLTVRQKQAMRDKAAGIQSLQHFFEKTDSLCHLVAPETVSLSGYPQVTDASLCTVLCLDKNEEENAWFEWDRKTETLISAGNWKLASTPASAQRVSLSEEQAVQRSWQWLQTLGITESSQPWSLHGTPQLSRAWLVNWQTQKRFVRLWLHKRTGELITVQVMDRTDKRQEDGPGNS